MKDIKEFYPVDMEDYAIEKGIDKNTCICMVDASRNHKEKIIISKVKYKHWARTHKFRLRIPKEVEEFL